MKNELWFKQDSCLSNYYECEVFYDGRLYSSSEAAYQSMKTTDTVIRDKFIGLTPDESKQLGRSLIIRPDWNDVKIQLMYDIIYAKFTQNKECRDYLINLDYDLIVEDTTGWHDNIWGICTCSKCQGKGTNYLGRLLSKLKTDLLTNGFNKDIRRAYKGMEKVYTSIELPTTVPGVGYTLKHRNAVEQLIRYYCKQAIGRVDGNGQPFTQKDYEIMCNRGRCHDMDKVLCSLSYPQLTADYFHRMFNGHHEESMIEPAQKNKYDWMEMIFDMESAKYTKPDKQGGGAYAYASKYKQHIMGYLIPYFTLFNLAKEDSGIVESIKQDVNRKYYETDLNEAFLNYIHTTRLHLLDGLSRIDDKGYMAMFGQATPLRHRSTQNPNGIVHQRPNKVSQMSRSVTAREMVHGTFEAQIFDMDSICQLTPEQVKGINKQALSVVKTMSENKMQR